MLRIACAIMITASCMYMGFAKNRELLREINITSDFLKALCEMSLNIKNRLTPVFELVRSGIKNKDSTGVFFQKLYSMLKSTNNKRLSELWSEAVYECFKDDVKDRALFSALCEIGECLGRYDEESQIKELDMAYEKLSLIIREQKVRYDKGKKVYLSVYTSAGIILSIILL